MATKVQLTIAGPAGCGKTTLRKLLNLPPEAVNEVATQGDIAEVRNARGACRLALVHGKIDYCGAVGAVSELLRERL